MSAWGSGGCVRNQHFCTVPATVSRELVAVEALCNYVLMNMPSMSELGLGVVIALVILVTIGAMSILPEMLNRRRQRQLLAPPSGEEDRGPSVGTPSNVLDPPG